MITLVLQRYSPPYVHELNGVAERFFQTVIRKARAMQVHSGVSWDFWPEILHTATLLKNISPTEHIETTPYHRWYKKHPPYHVLRVFGCLAYCRVVKDRNKYDTQATKMVLLGYNQNMTGYRLLNPLTNKILVRHYYDVKFAETMFPYQEWYSKEDETPANYKTTDVLQSPSPVVSPCSLKPVKIEKEEPIDDLYLDTLPDPEDYQAEDNRIDEESCSEDNFELELSNSEDDATPSEIPIISKKQSKKPDEFREREEIIRVAKENVDKRVTRSGHLYAPSNAEVHGISNIEGYFTPANYNEAVSCK
ncbi:MAG: hypothetical protein NXI00_23870, partial [Cytophagales bacterium]|nr:hypothetical protein [Cytophagales bacterium]